MRYDHLGLIDWPFQTVPDESFCTFMADRTQLVEDITKTLRNLSRRDQSTIHVLWAWYGSGKTHTLRYISHLCKTEYKNLIPIYIEFPRGAKSFLNLYKGFITSIDTNLIIDAYMEIQTDHEKWEIQQRLERDYSALSKALTLICMGNKQQVATATSWITGENVPVRELRDINISSRIETVEQALQVITGILNIVNWARTKDQNITRLIWMIDEFQRINQIRPIVQQDINGCLTAMFNRCPRSFSLFLSFSGMPSKKMPPWLSTELADRIGLERVMLLPPLTSKEAYTFILDVLKQFRDKSNPSLSPLRPYSEEAIITIIEITQSKVGKSGLKPRNILQACNAVLEEAEPQIENGNMDIINGDFVHNILEDLTFLETENGE